MIQIPVYDGMGNLIGYLQVAVFQLTDQNLINQIMTAYNSGSARIENNTIIFFDSNGNAIGSIPSNVLMRSQINPDLPSTTDFNFIPLPPRQGGEMPTDGGTPIITTTRNPIIPPTMPPIITGGDENVVLTTNTPQTSEIKQTSTTGTTPPPWDPSKPCPTVFRIGYDLYGGSNNQIDFAEIKNEIDSYLTRSSKVSSMDSVDSTGKTVRRFYVDGCDFLRNVKIPSDPFFTIFYSTQQNSRVSPVSGINFEVEYSPSNIQRGNIRDGLIDGRATPTYFDRLCELLKSNYFKTRDFYVVFNYQFVDRNGVINKIYFTSRVFVDANGNCVCVNQKLEYCDCKQYTLSLRNLRVVSEPGIGFSYSTTQDPSSPWYNKNLPADKQKVCFLKADVFRCCINEFGDSISSERIGEIILDRSVQSTEWVDCILPNGNPGKKIKVTQYFLVDQYSDGAFVQFRFDENFLRSPRGVGFKFPTADLRGDEIYSNQRTDIYWSDCDSTGRKSLWGDYIREKISNTNGGTLQQFTQYYADVTSGTNRKFNSYPPWRQSGAVTSNPPELALVTKCGADEGDCIEEPTTPPPPSKEPTKYCVIIDSFERAKEIDLGQHIITSGPRAGKILPAYTGGRNTGGLWILGGIRYGGIVYDGTNPDGYNALQKFIESSKTFIPGPTTTTRGNRVNLASEGLPCETGIFETTNSSLIEQYGKYKICYTISEEAGKEGRLIGVEVQGGNFGTFNGNTIFSNGTPVLDPTSREYDPNGGCCESLKWPDNRVSNRDYVIPGQILNMPPPNIAYLDYDYSSEELVMKDSCGCEMIPIADIWCYYNGSKKFKWRAKDPNDPTTHTGKPIAVADERCIGDGAKVYHPFDVRKDISFSVRKDKTAGLFDGEQSLNCYLTSSITSSNSNSYYYAVNDCLDCTKSPYFAVAYGHFNGSGSLTVNSDPNNTKRYADAIYSQYQLLCNETTRSIDGVLTLPKFSFVSESVQLESNDIYVVNFYRAGLSDKLDPGNFQINMAYLSGSFYANNFHTGSNVKIGSGQVMQFIDNSDDFSQRYLCEDDVLTSYAIVSGSLENGKYQDAEINTYGRVYPSLGIVVFHPKRLNENLGFNTVTGSNIGGDNAYKLFTAISGAASPITGRTDLHPMLARNVSYKTTHHYSVRLYKGQSNYSNNPTYVTGSKNRIFDKCFINQPQTYVTSVGLYNENYELLAIAKLTRPLKKDFDSDLLIKIRLNW